MNKQKYLLKKALINQSIEYRSACKECLRPVTACMCKTITPFATNFHFCILMHPMEARPKQVGTGRMANKALSNCKILTGIDFNQDSQFIHLIENPKYAPYLLYPGADSINISTTKLDINYFENKIPLIFILDATWACSKKMLKLTTKLHKIPKISFSPSILSKFAIKRQPKDFCLSTIESIHRVISELEKQELENTAGKKEELPQALARMVKFQLACRERPDNKKYTHRRHGGKSASA